MRRSVGIRSRQTNSPVEGHAPVSYKQTPTGIPRPHMRTDMGKNNGKKYRNGSKNVA